IWIFPRHSVYITLGFIFSSVLLYAIFFSNPLSLMSIDVNMPIRLILIRDAIAGLTQSNLLGIGFGTESVANTYYDFGIVEFQNSEDVGFIHLAAHNSFATVAF